MGRSRGRMPNVFNVEQLQKIFEVVDRPKLGIAMFVAFFCGLRINEVCKLKTANIDLKTNRLKVEDSKNTNRARDGYGKDRYVPIPKVARGPIRRWLNIIGEDAKWFLPSMVSPDKHLRKKSLYEHYRHNLKMAGLLVPIYTSPITTGPNKGGTKTKYKYVFHTLRHSYATYLLGKGVDIFTISKLLGHTRIDTTQVYLHLVGTQKHKAVDEAFSTPLMDFKPNFNQQVPMQTTQPRTQIMQVTRTGIEATVSKSKDPEIMRLELEKARIELEKMKLWKEQVKIEYSTS